MGCCVARVAGLLLFPLPLIAMDEERPKGADLSPSRNLLPFQAVERTLANGLKAIVVPTGFPNIVSLQIPVQTGSRNEVEPGKSGFAHFFEHMMFRGTKELPPEKYQAILNRAGARQNAYTTDDYTNYHVTFAKEDLEEILRIEADRFRNLHYAEADFRTEARAVLGEYNKNSAEPLTKLLEVQRDHAFAVHTYKHTTMGFLKDIEDMPNQFAYSREFFSRWYRPEYTTIIVAGDVAPAAVFPLIERYWGGWESGGFQIEIPREPASSGPVYAHTPWTAPTLPWVTAAFHGPAFSETDKEYAAMDTLLDLTFGPTSDVYKQLVVDEQIVDQFFPYAPPSADPSLVTVAARVKDPADAVRVRDVILKAFAAARGDPVGPQRLEDAKANARYGLLRTLDNTESIAALLARFVRHRRSFDTLNNVYQLYDALSPADLQAVARRYFTDAGLVVATLSHGPLPKGIDRPARLAELEAAAGKAGVELPSVVQRSLIPLIHMKLLFAVGSAQDPPGKEGLASLAASMIADAGSRQLRIDEIEKAFYPMAASFSASIDKEMTVFTGVVHKDNWEKFLAIALPMLLDPGFRSEDFTRLQQQQLNTLKVDLRSDDEEELGKIRLEANIFAGTRYAHPVLGTVAGLGAITLDDVKAFVRDRYSRSRLTLGVAGQSPETLLARLERELAGLPAGGPPAAVQVAGRSAKGIEVEIIQKETRAAAISFGFPIEVTRSHPDFAALSVARAWLGEHRSSMSHLFQRIREVRGMNYGDYAYIEAFPDGGSRLFPPANVARQAQIFQVWIRPVLPQNAHMALRIAIWELAKLIENGLSEKEFTETRDYLSKNVFLLTATQDQQLGYALDSRWYGIGQYTAFLRERLAKLTREDVHRAIRRHLASKDLSVVIVTRDAEALRENLVSDAFSPITYDAPKPQLAEEDRVIGSLRLHIRPDAVRVTPVDEVFAR